MYRRRPVTEAATAGEVDGDQATTESAGAGPSNNNAVTPPESETPKKRKVRKSVIFVSAALCGAKLTLSLASAS